MLFNSVEFAIFFTIVFVLYWFVFNRNLKSQNLLLLLSSYTFYGWWDWRFLGLIALSSLFDYVMGIYIERSNSHKKKLFEISVIFNLGLLFLFKYFNFFVDGFIQLFDSFGVSLQERTLNVILPVGISFYTFQSITYTHAVYKGKLKATHDVISFFAYVSFFPQLLAGPIERAPHFLPQFLTQRHFDTAAAINASRLILWGLFKKLVIADNCAVLANAIFSNYSDYSGSILLLGAILFAFQIYGDFSGYSDMAIGIAKLLGFNLSRNFAFPYFSKDFSEFWKRWHITLSQWFRDFVYIPLGGNQKGKLFTVRNIFIVFLLSGLWHGANWTFVAWGFIHFCLLLPSVFKKSNSKKITHLISIKNVVQIAITFFLTTVAWVFFRADNIAQAFNYLSRMFSKSMFSLPEIELMRIEEDLKWTSILLFFFVAVEWIQRKKEHALVLSNIKSAPLRWMIYYAIVLVILWQGGEQQDFIYFQF